jgi:hypothetical protein
VFLQVVEPTSEKIPPHGLCGNSFESWFVSLPGQLLGATQGSQEPPFGPEMAISPSYGLGDCWGFCGDKVHIFAALHLLPFFFRG